MNNRLFYGDNLEVLRKHIRDESVDLCYIDPPFNSKRNYNQIYNNVGDEDKAQAQAFMDTWTWDDHANQALNEIKTNYHGKFTSQNIALVNGLIGVLGKGSLLAYLLSMTLRIVEIHRVLKDTGSFYLHCDPTASHYLKIVLDSIFCPKGGNYLNEIIWTYDSAGRATKNFHKKHDTIFWYSKNAIQWQFNGRVEDVGVPREPKNHMRMGEDEDGRKFYEKTDKVSGKVYKWYLDNFKIRNDWWDDIVSLQAEPADVIYVNALNREDRERLGYPTQKPEALLERIIKASSNEGDVILDAYCGCGTTIAVAQRLNRSWIGIDITYQSISLILKRLEDSFGRDILKKIQLNGIPKDIKSAIALANKQDDRTRKEFEKWAVLTYSNNRAVINERKGADKGIDGIAYFQGDGKQEKIIFQVKSGKVGAKDIRDLVGTVTTQEASIGVFITLNDATREMLGAAKTMGIYQSKYMNQCVDKIQIVTVQEIIEEKKCINISLMFEVLKSAEKQQEIQAIQPELDLAQTIDLEENL